MSFQVVLPSNASFDEFPNNKNNHYFVRLEQPLNLQSGEWEVGLLGVQYPNNWVNVTNGSLIVTRQAVGNKPAIIYTIKPRPGRYSSMVELIRELHRLLATNTYTNDVLGVLGLDRMVSFYYDPIRNKVYLIIKNITYAVRFSSEFAEIFGFEKDKTYHKPFSGRESIMSPKTPDVFKGHTSLYIYSNLVKPYRVGDTTAPLLRTVGVDNRSRYTNIDKEFRNIHYHEVDTISSDIVEVDIRRDNGDRIPFTGGKTVLIVHFRKRV